jgi:hypothetical protein
MCSTGEVILAHRVRIHASRRPTPFDLNFRGSPAYGGILAAAAELSTPGMAFKRAFRSVVKPQLFVVSGIPLGRQVASHHHHMVRVEAQIAAPNLSTLRISSPAPEISISDSEISAAMSTRVSRRLPPEIAPLPAARNRH